MRIKNNFDFLRLVFAVCVIITHSYPISGIAEQDWLAQITRHQMTFSHLGVAGFFSISGYLVMQSLLRSSNLTDYFIKRILRLYPALLGMLSLTVLLGYFLCTGSILNYLNNISLWTYIPCNLSLFKLQYGITGIFENNPFKGIINGSLCTLPYEGLFYILLSVLFFIKQHKIKILLLSVAFIIIMLIRVFLHSYFVIHKYPFYYLRLIDFSGYFIPGALLSFCNTGYTSNRKKMIAVSILLWVAAIYFHVYVIAQFAVLPFTIVLFGSLSTPLIDGIKNKIGDLSYGIYIYAFPVQQSLEHFFRLSYLPLMFFGTIATIPFAFLSWNLIEKRALALKQNL